MIKLILLELELKVAKLSHLFIFFLGGTRPHALI